MSGPAAGILYIKQNASAFSEMFCECKTLHVFIDENTSYAEGVLHIAKQYFISEFVGRQPDKFRFSRQLPVVSRQKPAPKFSKTILATGD